MPETPSPAEPACPAPLPWHRRLGAGLLTLKLRVALGGAVALAVGIASTTGLLLHRAERDTVLAAERHEVGEAVRGARMIDRQIAQLQRTLMHAASALEAADLADPARLRRFFEGKVVLVHSFDNLAVADGRGRVLLHADARGVREPGVSIADRPYFRRAFQERRPTVSEVVVGRISGEPLVVLAQPIERDGELHGMLMGTLLLQRLGLAQDLTEEDPDGDGSQLVVVTDTAGRIIGHPDPQRIGSPIVAEPRLAEAVARWRAQGAPMEPLGLNLGDAQTLAAVAAAPGSEWLVWRWHDTDSALAPIAAARREAVWLALAMTLLMGGLFAASLAWGLRPLAQLQARARRMFDRSLAPEAGWPVVHGEIGALARVLRQVGAERAALESANDEALQRLQSVMAAAPVGISFTREGRFELLSREMCRLLRRDERTLLGRPAELVFASPKEYAELGPKVAAAFAAGRPFDGEIEILRGDGSRFAGRMLGMPVDPSNRLGSGGGTIWTLTDVTEEVAARRVLEHAAAHDALTGLANRKTFERRVAALFEARGSETTAALLMLDLDRFKPVNDQHGHAAGDAVLRAVAAVLHDGVRQEDTAARLGGDEFAVLLPGCPLRMAERIAAELLAAIAGLRVPWHGQRLEVGVSIGIAMLDARGASGGAEAWIAAADGACYEAKSGGRGRVCVAQPEAGRHRLTPAGTEAAAVAAP